jgi:metallo-beta-lactamase class B
MPGQFLRTLLVALLAWGPRFSHAQDAPQSQRVEGGVGLLPIAAGVAVHTSFKNFNRRVVPANGLVVKTKAGLVLVDATWDPWIASNLAKQARKQYGKRVKYLILTNAHEDRIGGLAHWQRMGVQVICHAITARELVARGFAQPQIVLDRDTLLTLGDTQLEISFPGPGHTPDNLVVWLPETQVLFGGGLVRSATTRGPGDLADADLDGWKAALEVLHARYLHARVVVPGIGQFGGGELLKHSHNIILRTLRRSAATDEY